MAAAEEQVAEESQEPEASARVPGLSAARFKQAEYSRNVFAVTVPDGTDLDTILDQNYWQHVAYMMKPGDRIEVMDDRMSVYMELIVRAVDRLWAHVAPIRISDLSQFDGQVAPIKDSDYKIDFAGAHHKWRVLYKGNELRDGFDTEGLARRWAANHANAAKR